VITRQRLIDDLFDDGWIFIGLDESHELLMQHPTKDWVLAVANDWPEGQYLFWDAWGDAGSMPRNCQGFS
jgi:hypothetical protein